jgi:hypothetical protein
MVFKNMNFKNEFLYSVYMFLTSYPDFKNGLGLLGILVTS